MKKIRKRLSPKKILLFALLLICLNVFLISIMEMINWKKDSNNTQKEITKVQNIIDVIPKEDTPNTEIIEPEEVKKEDPYWDFIKQDLIEVDFSELKNINSDVVGWIQVNGTNINYPFVQTKNNDYYLTHSFEKKWNDAGWVFMDYRNDIDNMDKNTIIYAHSRLDTTMFGSLKNVIKKNWYTNPNNYIVKLSTETENTLWQVFSVYHIPTNNDYIQTEFSTEEEYKSFLNLISNRSIANFKTTVNTNDIILTLSTCYINDEKIALHAKLIKRESR